MSLPRETPSAQSGVENELRPINLALVDPFRLGVLEVYPSTRQVRAGPREVIAEPRVLQVLITLSEAGSAVISRED